jgi:hypothetical protein
MKETAKLQGTFSLLNSDVFSVEKEDGYEQYQSSFICMKAFVLSSE